MARRCLRKGVSRYALKRLHEELTELERARGIVDLAIEAKYLSVVWHPNIIKIRGVCDGNMLQKDFFFIMDRLYGTLDQRMSHWSKRAKKAGGGVMGIGKNKVALKQLLLERMIVGYDRAAALMYLHENR